MEERPVVDFAASGPKGPHPAAERPTMRNEESDVERVGFVGLGAIGGPMAHRLLVSGFEVAVFDIVPERSRKLVELGAVEVRDPEEAAMYGDATVVMVATGDQALEAIFGDRGGLPGSLEGQDTGSYQHRWSEDGAGDTSEAR